MATEFKLSYTGNQINTKLGQIDNKVDKIIGKDLSTNDYTTEEKNKLAGIATGANAYTHPSYTAKSSGLYKITVDGTGHVSGTTAVTKSDITALGIPTQDTVYTHPTHTAISSGLYKITVDSNGHVSGATSVAKSDITALGIPAQDTTYSLNSFGISVTATELNYVDGVTSNVQTQLNDKMPISGGTMTGALIAQNNANYTTKQVRNIILIAEGENVPSGSNGDICLVYTP